MQSHLVSHLVSEATPLGPAALQQLASAGALDEISNAPDSVRHYVYWNGMRDRETNRLRKPLLFFVYETGRHGPQNGFRLCLVHQGFYIDSPTQAGGGDSSDAIDQVELPIPPGHVELVILGEKPDAAADASEQ